MTTDNPIPTLAQVERLRQVWHDAYNITNRKNACTADYEAEGGTWETYTAAAFDLYQHLRETDTKENTR